GLLFGSWRSRAALVGASTLAVFTVALVVNQFVAPGSVCGCWFSLTLAKSGSTHVALNLVLLGLALTVWGQGGSGQDEANRNREAPPLPRSSLSPAP
ncbi:MAG: hypothetical protein KDD47_28110, partial [Acidobacteria bacterium]|nr:hypothetical protein [Acidobacteriota bacterium]